MKSLCCYSLAVNISMLSCDPRLNVKSPCLEYSEIQQDSNEDESFQMSAQSTSLSVYDCRVAIADSGNDQLPNHTYRKLSIIYKAFSLFT